MSKQSRRPGRAARHEQGWTAKKDSGGRRANILLGVALAVVAVALIAAVSIVGGSNGSGNSETLAVGKKAPSFEGEDVMTGREVTSEGLKGKNVLYFFNEGVMCQACLVQIQALEQHVAHFQKRHLELVSITNDEASTLRQAGMDYGITTPLVADTSGELTTRFGAMGGGMHSDTADHEFILVDKRGIVRFDKDFPSMWIEPAKLLNELRSDQ